MRAVLDACVLYPTVLREVLFGVARAGTGEPALVPLWSARLLEEWIRAARRTGGAVDEMTARAEAAEAARRFPGARVAADAGGDAGAASGALWLPDPADIHVLQTAIAGRAEVIVTLNLRDFPARELAVHGVRALAPDALLMEMWLRDAGAVEGAVAAVHAEAERRAGSALPLRGLLKRARLPRLGKALDP